MPGKINPYFRPSGPGAPISQFVEEKLPAELIMSNLKGKQAIQDKWAATRDQLKLWDARAVTNRDKNLIDSVKKDVDALSTEWSNKDLTTGEAASAIRKMAMFLRDDPRLKIAKQHVAYEDALRESRKKEGAEFFDKRWRDWQRQKYAYDSRGDMTTEGDSMREVLGAKHLKRRDAQEKYFNNLRDNLTETFGKVSVQGLETYMKTGRKGILPQDVMRQLEGAVVDYMSTPEGKQDIEIYEDIMLSNGKQPTREGAREYVRSLLGNAGMERVGQDIKYDVQGELNRLGKLEKDKKVYAYSKGVGAASWNQVEEAKQADENKLSLANAERRIKQYQEKLIKKKEITPDEKKSYDIALAEASTLRNELDVYNETVRNIEKQMDGDVWSNENVASLKHLKVNNKLQEAIRNGHTYETYIESLSEEEKAEIEATGGLKSQNASFTLGAPVYAATTQKATPKAAYEFNKIAAQYRKKRDKVLDDNKIVQKYNALLPKGEGELNNILSTVNTTLKAGNLEWSTLTGSLSSDKDLIEEMPLGPDNIEATSTIHNNKPVFLLHYKVKDGDKVVNKTKQVVLGGEAGVKASKDMAQELVKYGQNSLIKDMGHSMLGYHLPPTTEVNAELQNKGSVGEQLYKKVPQLVPKGSSFNIYAFGQPIRITKAKTQGDDLYRIHAMVGGKYVDVIQMVTAAEGRQGSKAIYTSTLKDILAYINKVTVAANLGENQ